MAKLEKNITGDFDSILRRIEDGIINGSVSASLEESNYPLLFLIATPIRNAITKTVAAPPYNQGV